MSVRMRVNRSHTGNRRSHHALKEPRLSTCAKCGAAHLRHRMCPECGQYRGREVVDIAGKKVARIARRNEKLKAMGVDTDALAQEAEESKKEEKAEVAKKTATKKTAAKKAAKKATKQAKDEK